MKMPFFNCFVLDLRPFTCASEVREFLMSCNLQDKIDYMNMWKSKKGKFTEGKPVTKVWFDATTFHVIAYSHWNEQNFTNEFIRFISNLKPIELNQKFEMDSDIEELTVDNILDKINKKGIDALTVEEKRFLDSM
jgi:hypothetical protein